MKKICSSCGLEKKLESFGKNKQVPGGIEKRCKICKNNYNKKYRKENSTGVDGRMLKLNPTKKEDWCKTYQFLKQIGYDVTKDIHEQFAKKNGLTYKERPARNILQYTWRDCLDGFDVANLPTN
jgi:hypothetical protein